MRGFLNSLIITFCGVMVNLIVTLPTSYALSRSNFSGKKPITIFYLITMFFGGGLIPTYLVIQRLPRPIILGDMHGAEVFFL